MNLAQKYFEYSIKYSTKKSQIGKKTSRRFTLTVILNSNIWDCEPFANDLSDRVAIMVLLDRCMHWCVSYESCGR